jgi:hypothetical protein
MFLRCLALPFVLFLSVASSHGQTASTHNDWHKVQKLKPHTPVAIALRSGEWLRGNLVLATDTQLRVEQEVMPAGSGLVTLREIQRADVQRVYRISRPFSKLTRQIIGGAIGLGVAVGVGAIVDSQAKSHEDDGLAAVVTSLITIPIGIAVGGHTHGSEKQKLIYEAPN